MFDWSKDRTSPSIWSYLFDSEYKQRTDLHNLTRTTERLRAQVDDNRDLQRQVAALQEQVAGLALFNRALLTALTRKGIVTPEQFNEILVELDLEDGVLDGQ